MKENKSHEEVLRSNHRAVEISLETDDLEEAFGTISSENMMADSSFNASITTTKMLLPHEIGVASNNVSQHSIHDIHHGTSFYHTPGTVATANTAGFNGFHNSFSNYATAHNLNGIGTSSFSNLVHHQPIGLSNNHSIAISSTMPPPLILYHQTQPIATTAAPPQTLFYTSSTTNNLSNNTTTATITNEIEKKTLVERVNANDNKDLSREDQLLPVASSATTTTTDDINTESNQAEDPDAEEPEIDIVISNVVCAFSVRCHLSLKEIALHGSNVEYKRENGMVTMKLRKPYTTASIWSSGKVTCTGATSEEQAKIAARRTARILQKLNFRVRFHNYRVVNVLGTCKMPWAIKIVQFSEKYKKDASYEPELHPGVTYNLKNPTATLKIFSTGSMTVTARSVADVQAAIEHIYPLVYEFKKPRVEQASAIEEEIVAEIIETDIEGDDDDDEIADDPLQDDDEEDDDEELPPNKKQKFRDISHLTKRYKGPKKGRPKRPLGKMNDPKQDLIYVSDGDLDGDDF